MTKTTAIRIYLDTCTFNRPFDDQIRLDVKFEAEAKLHIQDYIKQCKLELVWSYILEYENSVNPFLFRKITIQKWKDLACVYIIENNNILSTANNLMKKGLKSKDALHLACAIESKAKYFITTDKKVIKRMTDFNKIIVINPVSFIVEIYGDQEC